MNSAKKIVNFSGEALAGKGVIVPEGGYAIIDDNTIIREGDIVNVFPGGTCQFASLRVVTRIDHLSVSAETAYTDGRSNTVSLHKTAEIGVVVTEIYDKMTQKQIYKRDVKKLKPNNIREIIKMRGLKSSQICKKLNVSPQTMWNWSSGNGYPSIKNIKQLSDLLQISADEVIASILEA